MQPSPIPSKESQLSSGLLGEPQNISAVAAHAPEEKSSGSDTDPFGNFDPYRLTSREEKQREIFKAISKMPELWETIGHSRGSELDEETHELVAEAAQRFSFDKVGFFSILGISGAKLPETATSFWWCGYLGIFACLLLGNSSSPVRHSRRSEIQETIRSESCMQGF